LDAVPHIERLMVAAFDDMLAHADHIVVTQRPTGQFQEKLAACGKPLLALFDGSYLDSSLGAAGLLPGVPFGADTQAASAALPALASKLAQAQLPVPASVK
jgi:hypothetical protein